jgi:LEA14-like dessication related protein
MNRSRSWIGVLLLAVAAFPACSSPLEEPEVKLDGVSVGSIGLEGGTLRVRLNVTNPNSFGLQAERLDYVLEVADESGDGMAWDTLTAGSYTERITIEADDSAFVEIPIRFRYRDLGTAISSLLATGSFDYRISGTVQMREPMRRAFDFRRTGNTDEFRD